MKTLNDLLNEPGYTYKETLLDGRRADRMDYRLANYDDKIVMLWSGTASVTYKGLSMKYYDPCFDIAQIPVSLGNGEYEVTELQFGKKFILKLFKLTPI